MKNINEILKENQRRNALLLQPYDPIKGIGASGDRQLFNVPDSEAQAWLPMEMVENEDLAQVLEDKKVYRLTRIRYDFEYWCAMCVTIRDKRSGRNVKLILNAPQRKLLAEIERQRLAGNGIRLVLLKARQWGGSTMVLMYMAWVQIVLCKNWNSLICGHMRSSSSAIKGMYTKLLNYYPKEFLPEGIQLKFKRYEGHSNAQMIVGRDCVVVIGSAHSEDVVRGFDISMAHLSEVAFWPSGKAHNPEDLMRSVDGAILEEPLTLEVLESTANGIGTFFHSEWLLAKMGKSNKTAVFVPWYEIELYRLPVADAKALWESLDDYERDLWEKGCTLEMINWYHEKRKGYQSHYKMMAEFPSNDIEAFALSGSPVFASADLERLREGCMPPRRVGEIMVSEDGNYSINFSGYGQLKVWDDPVAHTTLKNRYLVSVDVGGRSEKADYSVITVLDRKETPDEKPEVVAQWRGHTDYDHLAWRAFALSKRYHNALLIFESNTLETHRSADADKDYILDVLENAGANLYCRDRTLKGFHTNKTTKNRLVHHLIAIIRDSNYIERDIEAVDEFGWFETKAGDSYGAIKGKHDDIVMSRGIALLLHKILPRTPHLTPSDFL